MIILKHIPNTITCLNLTCGALSIISTASGDYKWGILFIITAAILDFFDGFAARLLKCSSPIGKELDSLADVVSFGVAPALMMYYYAESFNTNFIEYICLIIAPLSGLRLAKFNLDTRQTENFIGLATPSCALLCGSLIYSTSIYPELNNLFTKYTFIIPTIAVILSILLVSEIPMFSFKFKDFKWQNNATRFIFIAITILLGIATILLRYNWSIWVALIFTSYILINLICLPLHNR